MQLFSGWWAVAARWVKAFKTWTLVQLPLEMEEMRAGASREVISNFSEERSCLGTSCTDDVSVVECDKWEYTYSLGRCESMLVFFSRALDSHDRE